MWDSSGRRRTLGNSQTLSRSARSQLDGRENGRESQAHSPQEGYTVRFMHSRVAHAESELERQLRTAARQSLGPDATAVQVDVVVARTQQGPRRPRVGDDTYVRRLVKEETRRLEDAQFERWKR